MCVIERSLLGKNNGNPDMVCETLSYASVYKFVLYAQKNHLIETDLLGTHNIIYTQILISITTKISKGLNALSLSIDAQYLSPFSIS